MLDIVPEILNLDVYTRRSEVPTNVGGRLLKTTARVHWQQLAMFLWQPGLSWTRGGFIYILCAHTYTHTHNKDISQSQLLVSVAGVKVMMHLGSLHSPGPTHIDNKREAI